MSQFKFVLTDGFLRKWGDILIMNYARQIFWNLDMSFHIEELGCYTEIAPKEVITKKYMTDTKIQAAITLRAIPEYVDIFSFILSLATTESSTQIIENTKKKNITSIYFQLKA